MVSSKCQEKDGIQKGPWSPQEDNILSTYIQQHGHGIWHALPAKAGLKRCGKSCRLRWNNYLRPGIKRGKFTPEEEQSIINLHALLGNKWSAIAAHLPKRTDNEIKNYWNTHLKKKLEKMGIDPSTHKRKFTSIASSPNLCHIAQWESARLEAEARLVRESKFRSADSSLLFPRPRCLDVLKAWQEMVFGLESPTSILNFPQNSFTMHNTTNIPVPQLHFPCSSNEVINKLNGSNDWIFANEYIDDYAEVFNSECKAEENGSWSVNYLPENSFTFHNMNNIISAPQLQFSGSSSIIDKQVHQTLFDPNEVINMANGSSHSEHMNGEDVDVLNTESLQEKMEITGIIY